MTRIKLIYETPTSSIAITLDINKSVETTIEALRSALDSIENDNACWVRVSEEEDEPLTTACSQQKRQEDSSAHSSNLGLFISYADMK
ncbi:3386_t:CDS:2, partial [Paraglomus brasilianum]